MSLLSGQMHLFLILLYAIVVGLRLHRRMRMGVAAAVLAGLSLQHCYCQGIVVTIGLMMNCRESEKWTAVSV
jgi:hypothetical protein